MLILSMSLPVWAAKLTTWIFVQDLKDIVRDEAGRTGNYLGDIVIDPERSDFLGKIIWLYVNISQCKYKTLIIMNLVYPNDYIY